MRAEEKTFDFGTYKSVSSRFINDDAEEELANEDESDSSKTYQ
jgi:hypothetical protein